MPPIRAASRTPMTTDALLTQLTEAFGPSAPVVELANDLAGASARRFQRPELADPVPLPDDTTHATLFLFQVYAWSLPWLEPAQLARHVSALMHTVIVDEVRNKKAALDRHFQCLGFMLSPDNPPSIRAHLRSLWRPLTAPQRACIAAYLRHTEAATSSQAAWARVVAHDASAQPGDWADDVWQNERAPELGAVLAQLEAAFPVDSLEPWTELPVLEPFGCYLPFAPAERLDRLLPALASFALREPEHQARPWIIRQLYLLLQPICGPLGTPLLRERLSVLSQGQRQAVCGVVRSVFEGDDVRDLWAQAADLGGADWLARLRRPEWEPEGQRGTWLGSAREACGHGPDDAQPQATRDYSVAALVIEAAFDEVEAADSGPSGSGRPTLFEAEYAESFGTNDVSNGRLAHRGRWQDLPFDELRDCPSALAFLSAQALRYYVPAVMTRYLNWRDTWTENDDERRYLGLFDSLEFMISPCPDTYELREHYRERLSAFTVDQRRAIHTYMAATGADDHAIEAWGRVVAHDASGAPGPWFDALWPERERPDLADVIALVRGSFQVPDPLPPLDSDHAPLYLVGPEAFAERFAREALLVLGMEEGPDRDEAANRLKWAIHPNWGRKDQPEIRARLAVLTPAQRRAVSAVCDVVVDNAAMRQMWRSAIEHDGEDWFEFLKMP